ncbi:MAG: hypothetical protein KJZ93_25475, partial [Caldilineaceae bacterium]|nr:hypothetical protein [Caldilineaceae bacterium]
MSKQILHLHLGNDAEPKRATVRFLDDTFTIQSIGVGGDIDTLVRLIAEADTTGSADAIALDGIATELCLGRQRIRHLWADRIDAA